VRISPEIVNCLAVPLKSSSVDVKFHPAEHIASLGSAAIVQATAQSTIKALVRSILRGCLEMICQAG
jgi:hypothetical protein